MAESFPTFRDHFLSIYQSAASAYAKNLGGPKKDSDVRARGGPADRPPLITSEVFLDAANEASSVRFFNTLSAGQPDATERGLIEDVLNAKNAARRCANLGMKYLEARVRGDSQSAERLRGQLDASTCDPNWANTLDEYVSYFGFNGTRREIPYIKASAIGPKVITILPNSKVAFLGDWGTGAKPAIDLLAHVKRHAPDVLIHLGDIYYSGTERECEINFRQILDAELDRKKVPLPVFSLAGNHDMYSGGLGYYALVKNLNPSPFDQLASFFCLRTSNGGWQFLGMDTGLHDYSPFSVTAGLTFFDAEEESWHLDRIREFSGKTILLSHHQLFSAFSQIGPADSIEASACNANLLGTFRKFQAAGAATTAWFWGHEHNLCIYKPYMGLQRGRCLGHGAIPTFTKPDPYTPLTNVKGPPELIADTRLRSNDTVFANGFGILTLVDNTQALAQYFQVLDGDCSLIYSEIIS